MPLYLVYIILRFFVSCLTSGDSTTGNSATGYDNDDDCDGDNDNKDDGNKDGGGRRRKRGGGGGGGAGVRIRWGQRSTGRRNHATATTSTSTSEQTTTNHCALKAGKRRPAEIASSGKKRKDDVDKERTSKEDSQSV